MTDSDIHQPVAYDRFFELCGKAFERHGDILDLEIGLHPYAYLKQLYMAEFPGGRVLDFGGGAQKPLQRALGLSDALYYSCDNDPTGHFTYSSPESIPSGEVFSIVTSSHSFEHIPFEVGISIAQKLSSHVQPGGVFCIAVPNPKHPTRYLSSPVHVTPWNYLNLCALFEMSGLNPFYCARTHKHKAPSFIERPFVHWMCRRFMMDWCDGIYVVGRRNS